MINSIQNLVVKNFDDIVSIRRYLHMYPELSFNEHNTSKFIKSTLKKWGVKYESVGETGVVVLIEGYNSTSKTIAFRADFDALPILEENEFDYCSKNQGVMHACGHDAHTASLLGVIKVLIDLKKDFEGTIKFIFQPAEEVFPGGAKTMIEKGVLVNPNVDKIFAQHVFPELEVGKVGFATGTYMASADEIFVEIIGKGGHAALPHTYNNPIVAAAELISNLEDYFYKYRDKPSVFAIGFINGDGYTNVIPEKVNIKGTFRTLDEDFRSFAHKKMQEISKKISSKFSLKIDFLVRVGYPVLENDIDLTLSTIKLAKEFLGEKNVVDLSYRMTAEDFAYYGQIVPSCFYRLGVANKKLGITHGLHTSRFNIDEEALKVGVGLMTYLALKQ
ncbi:MAG: M20 family metallopeptidase [Bacteroidota bacterium]|nr:M20 family metallopeptidase [Bacteroidota bacterium]